jgi:hypothetical protein
MSICGTTIKTDYPRLGHHLVQYIHSAVSILSFISLEVTWAISKYPERQQSVTNAQIDETMERALEMWGEVSSLKFKKVPADLHKIDIQITFNVKAHGDDDPFDGQNGVLAHAYFPQYGGDMHVDDEETWTLNTKKVRGKIPAFHH